MEGRGRFFTWFVIVSLLFALVSGIAVYHVTVNQLNREADMALRTLGHTIRDNLDIQLKQAQDRVRLVSSRTQLRRLLATYKKDSNPKHLLVIKRILRDAKGVVSDFQRLDIHDMTGRVLVSTSNKIRDLYAYQATYPKLKKNEVSLKDYRFVGKEPIHMFSTPLNWNGKRVGYLTVHNKMSGLYDYINEQVKMHSNGWVILLNEYNDQLRIMNRQQIADRALPKWTDKLQHDVLQIANWQNERHFVMTQKLRLTDWVLLVERNEKALFLNLEDNQTIFMWILIVSAVMIFFVAFVTVF